MIKIAVVTGSRAEYGLLYPLLQQITKDPEFELQLFVTCMHLMPQFGETYQVIEADGFTITEKVDLNIQGDEAKDIGYAVAQGVKSFTDVYHKYNPDLLLVLGDRFELLAAVQAAYIQRIPVAHIHGGEVTYGALDEGFRHAISKMSHLHFVAAEPYKKRLIQMGELPQRVFNVGTLGLDNAVNLPLLSKEQWQKELNCNLGRFNFLLTYHPCTLNLTETKQGINNLLAVLDYFPDAKIIATQTNSDEGGSYIMQQLNQYAIEHPQQVTLFDNLGSLFYLSALSWADVVIGNSSSGVIEAPFFKTPTVNIGSRQLGRLSADSVINSESDTYSISLAITKALSEEFKQVLKGTTSQYGCGNTAFAIMDVLKNTEFSQLLDKQFYDLQVAI